MFTSEALPRELLALIQSHLCNTDWAAAQRVCAQWSRATSARTRRQRQLRVEVRGTALQVLEWSAQRNTLRDCTVLLLGNRSLNKSTIARDIAVEALRADAASRVVLFSRHPHFGALPQANASSSSSDSSDSDDSDDSDDEDNAAYDAAAHDPTEPRTVNQSSDVRREPHADEEVSIDWRAVSRRLGRVRVVAFRGRRSRRFGRITIGTCRLSPLGGGSGGGDLSALLGCVTYVAAYLEPRDVPLTVHARARYVLCVYGQLRRVREALYSAYFQRAFTCYATFERVLRCARHRNMLLGVDLQHEALLAPVAYTADRVCHAALFVLQAVPTAH